MGKYIKSQSQWCISWCWDKTEAINQLPLMVKSAKSILCTSEAIKISIMNVILPECTHMYMYMCVWCIHTHSRMYITWGGGGQPACVFLHFSSSFLFLVCLFVWNKVSDWTYSLLLQLDRLVGQTAREIGRSSPLSTKVTGMSHHTAFYMGTEYPNLGPDTCPSSTLSAQQSLQPQSLL